MKCVLTLLVAFFLLVVEANASVQETRQFQTEIGTIRGTVVDPNGAVISGAEIRATLNGTTPARIFTAKTDDSGDFVLSALPFGDYSVLISAIGFAKYYTQVSLSRESAVSPHHATMQVSLGEIRINAQMVNIGDGATVCVICGYTYFSIAFADLPFRNRDPQQLVMLQQGVTEHNAGFSIGGRRQENKTALLDGVDARDPATGQLIASLSLDSLAEFNIDYTNADTSVGSSYGQNSAPQVSASGKSGTNTYHGESAWFLGRSGLAASNFFTNRQGLPEDQTKLDQFVFVFGGNLSVPHLFNGKDRAFLFTSFEHSRDRETTGRQIVAPLEGFIRRTTSIQGNLFRSLLSLNRIPVGFGIGLADLDGDGLNDIGDAAVLSTVNSSRDLGLARIDINIGQSLHVNLKYYADRARAIDDSFEALFTPSSPLDASRRGDVVGAQVISVINPTTSNDFRLAYVGGRSRQAGAGSDLPLVVAVNTPLGVGAGSAELPESRVNRSLFTGDNFLKIAGSHSFNAGGQATRRSERYATEGLARGRVYYSDALALISDGAVSAVDPSRAIVRVEVAEAIAERYRFTDFYSFANDNWRASTRLALNFGVGYNVYSGAIYERPTDKNNFAPFASFAYAPTHSESVILRGGAAILYVPPMRLPYGEIKATPLYPLAQGFARIDELIGSPFPSGWAQRKGAIDIEREYARDLRTAYTESAFFAIQNSIRERIVIEVGYNSTYGRRLTRVYRNDRPRVDAASIASTGEDPILIASDGNSSYHALQVRVTSRERRRLTFQAHYTLSKSIDTASDERPSMFRSLNLGPVDENHPELERGPSDFDRRHRAVGFFLWRGPEFGRLKAPWREFLEGWQLSGIAAIQSGPLVSLYSSGDFYGGLGDFNRDGVLNDRLAYSGPGRIRIGQTNPAAGYFKTNLFGAPGIDGRSPLGRNVLGSPAYSSVDLSIKKTVHITEAQQIEIRADVFNVVNRVNFARPITDLVSVDFGRSVEAAGSRVVRLALKYKF